MRHNYRMSEAEGSAGGHELRMPMTSSPGLRGRWLHHEPMKKHVSWRAGGVAQRVYIPADLDDLCGLVRSLPAEEPIHLFGLGSNLLIRDGGLTGVSVLLHGVLKKLALESRVRSLPPGPKNTRLVYAEAGVASPKLARFCANNDLVDGEFWAGIPGTVGGALAMNAGCYGHETWEKVAQVVSLNRKGQLVERGLEDYEIGYRHVVLRPAGDFSPASPQPNPLPGGEGANVTPSVPKPVHEWFIGAWFRLPQGDGAASRATIKSLLQKRIDTQPLQQPNAGSVFRNPPGDFAARLIESSGLKGYRIGGAQVSPKHANFIVNIDQASAADIERLIEHVETTVEARTQVRLHREVRIMGEHS
ncbi:MAG: UDP-N-acetylmuramate dehydrogenase [Thiobacillus sp.]